jgi:activating signal cointegrator 1
MKCISVWDPWATLIAIGAKGYETRSWRPPEALIGERIAIHASKNQDGMRAFAQDKTLQRLAWTAMHAAGIDAADPFRPGWIIATARIAFVIPTDGMLAPDVLPDEKAMGDWSPGRFAWRLTDLRTGFGPMAVRGKQGLFDVPSELQPRLA